MVSKEDKKLQLARFKTNTDSYKEFDLVYTSNLKIDEINNKKIPIITTYLYRDELQEFIKKYKIGYKSSSKFIPDDKSS